MIWHAEWSIPLRWLSPPADQHTAPHSARKLSKISALNTKFIDLFFVFASSVISFIEKWGNYFHTRHGTHNKWRGLTDDVFFLFSMTESRNCCQFLHLSLGLFIYNCSHENLDSLKRDNSQIKIIHSDFILIKIGRK